jgi:hypothetical protein
MPVNRSPVRVLLAGSGLCWCLLATAADTDPLAQQVEQLRLQLQALEQRVQQLEHPQAAGVSAGSPEQVNVTAPVLPTPAPAPAPAAAPVAGTPAAASAAPVTSVDPALQSLGRLKQAWHDISAGMNSAEIRSRLGEPAQQFTIDGKPVWYYSYPGVGNGSVMFSVGGQVLGAQHPPFGFW